MIEYQEIQPTTPQITPYVHLYSFSRGELLEVHEKLITRALPTFLIQFYFEFVGNLAKVQTKSSTFDIQSRGYVNTCQDSWMDIYQTASNSKSRAVKNFKIDLYPHALFEIFFISPLEIELMSSELKQIWGKGYDLLFEELVNAACAKEAIRIFELYFMKKIVEKQSHSSFESALFLKPHPSLQKLSKDMGYSSRWIQKRHLETFGISFKKAQGLMHFYKTIQQISLHVKNHMTPVNLMSIAYDNGYFDQAHFIKEFKRFCGLTPTEYIARKYNGEVLFYW